MLFDAVIKEALETIVKKIREGKKLSDAEVLLLIVSQIRRDQENIVKTIDDFKSDVNRRFEHIYDEIKELRDEIKLLRQEVMSIKSDIINVLKEKI